ncbi:hypothetical protein Glove_63g116 [Diversispora epigaea]|uniref:Uncharacterized protein n=1 Tax=Diversispora epigaea TaxID=1348612 RepID=A0A397JDH9_9GLOM|nr:hypothetical protein Glove_63g116 [Diversispora epigaea]
MSSNNTSNGTERYDATEDLIDVILNSLLPLLLLSLFEGFKKEKAKKRSIINKFDDIIIILSIVFISFICGFQWFREFSSFFKTFYVLNAIGVLIFGYFGYTGLLSKDEIEDGVFFSSAALVLMVFTGFTGILFGDLNVGPYFKKSISFTLYRYASEACIDNFGQETCSTFATLSTIVSYINILLIALIVASHYYNWSILKKLLGFTFLAMLIIYPAFVSGYLISNNQYITKIIFCFSIVSFTRLIDSCKSESRTATHFYIYGKK